MGATYQFTNNLTAVATAASQTKFESIATIAVKVRVKGDVFTNLVKYYSHYVFALPSRVKFGFTYGGGPSATQLQFRIWDANEGTGTDLSSPAYEFADFNATSWYVLYFHRIGSGTGRFTAELYTESGTLLASFAGYDTMGGAGGAGSGNGAVSIGHDAALSDHAWTIDGCAVYDAVLSGGDRYSVPTSGDSNIIALYKFDEGTGTSVADSVSGGTALTIAGSGTWNTSDGAWDGSGPPPASFIAQLTGGSPLHSLINGGLAR